jgi:hypothetical protein
MSRCPAFWNWRRLDLLRAKTPVIEARAPKPWRSLVSVRFRADLAAACLAEIRNASCEEAKRLPDCVTDATFANETHLLLEPASPTGSVCEYAR